MNAIVTQALTNSYTYEGYRNLVTELLNQGKVTGATQSEDLVHYTQLNEKRMHRLEKTIAISETTQSALTGLQNKYLWLVIAEGWCGDAAQLLPIIYKMAIVNPDKIDLQLVLRDDNLELMDQYLTNGGRAIPKLLIINKETGEVEDHWGPRPAGAVKLIQDYKATHGIVDETAKTELQLWYLHDKGLSTQNEIVEIMTKIEQQVLV